MKTRITITIIILFNIHLYSQSDFFTFEQMKVSQATAIENRFHSKEDIRERNVYFADQSFDWGKPKLYHRPEINNFPASAVTYIYSKNDSLVRKVTYNWRIKNYEKLNESERIAQYNIQFDKVVKLISKYCGEPEPNQGEITKKLEDVIVTEIPVYNYERQILWEYKNCTILASLIWTKDHGQSFVTQISWK